MIAEKVEAYNSFVCKQILEIKEKGNYFVPGTYEYIPELKDLNSKWLALVELRWIIKQNKMPRKTNLVALYNEIVEWEGVD